MSDRLALVSDCVYTLDPQTGLKGAARVPHPAFNLDTEQARASIRKLAALEPSRRWAGHTEPGHGRRARPARAGGRGRVAAWDAGTPAREARGAETSEYRDAEGNVLTLRGSLSPGTRRRVRRRVLSGGLEREDAWQRGDRVPVRAPRRRRGASPASSSPARRSCWAATGWPRAPERQLRPRVAPHARGRALPRADRRREQCWPGPGRIRRPAVRLVPAAGQPASRCCGHDDARGAARALACTVRCWNASAWPLLRALAARARRGLLPPRPRASSRRVRARSS